MGSLMAQGLFVPSLSTRTRGGSGSHITKYGFSFIFSSRYTVSMETRTTFPSFSEEGTVFTAIQPLLLKFCKIPPQGEWFLSKKPAVQLVGGSEPLLTFPYNTAFLSTA